VGCPLSGTAQGKEEGFSVVAAPPGLAGGAGFLRSMFERWGRATQQPPPHPTPAPQTSPPHALSHMGASVGTGKGSCLGGAGMRAGRTRWRPPGPSKKKDNDGGADPSYLSHNSDNTTQPAAPLTLPTLLQGMQFTYTLWAVLRTQVTPSGCT
jgi:hypothetical protein